MNLLLNANAKRIPIADASVNCVVTSPPYYGLRDYGTAEWVGGDENCEHNPQKPDGGVRSRYTLPLGRGGVYRDVCGKCGAIRVDKQIGLEVTPDEYIANLVAVFRECKRILRDDGTLWVNIGDSYNGNSANRSGQNGYNDGRENRDKRYSTGGIDGLKPKDLIGIPWMLAFALRADGWYLRQDIIWHKPNPMPESVKDRCTKAHEYIFLLTKSARYWYDNEAIKEDAVGGQDLGILRSLKAADGQGPTDRQSIDKRLDAGIDTRKGNPSSKRNKRSVWTVTTKPYPGSHYAVFPPDLIEPCILAGCPEGGLVLDPFAGSGTTLMVARKHRRNAIGLDLNFEYLTSNARERLQYGSYVPVADGINQLTIGGLL